MLIRTQYLKAWQELSSEKSMVFLSGPRQAGKTTLSKLMADSFSNSFYFNWDIHSDRSLLFEDPYFFEQIDRKDDSIPLIIFDEIHKYKNWKNYLKGVYDRDYDSYKFLVTISGRLDIYQKGGDSLAGRYYMFHLFPLSVSELAGKSKSMSDFIADPLQINMEGLSEVRAIWDNLSELSGFPEPYLSGRKQTYRRWSGTYANQLIREDIRDVVEIKSVTDIENLYLLLPSKTGSPLSSASLSEDIGVSYNSIRNWLSVFERFFLVFSIPTWTEKISRAILKERKYYLWDYPGIKNPAARFENMVAAELWRAVNLWTDMGHGSFTLHFVKNKEKQEVDFLIANNREPILLIEAKLNDITPSKSLQNFQKLLKIPAVQLTGSGESYRLINNEGNKILIAPAYQWLAQLP